MRTGMMESLGWIRVAKLIGVHLGNELSGEEYIYIYTSAKRAASEQLRSLFALFSCQTHYAGSQLSVAVLSRPSATVTLYWSPIDC
jgi:hypothetical protein